MLDLCFRGAIYSCSGYARIRHLIIELSKLGFNIQLKPFNIFDNVDLKDIDFLRSLEKKQISSPYISITTGIALQLFKDDQAAHNIGYTMFEANSLPKTWIDFCNKMDEVWVPSNSNKKTFEISNVTSPIKVIPCGIDEELFYPLNKDQNDVFTFLSIGTYIDRKGWDILLEAFVEEFTSNENVKLLIKLDGTNTFAEDEIRDKIFSYKNAPQISICNLRLDDLMIPKLYHKADCFVLPTRGEAFCIPALESLACGVPVLITDDGGFLDFLDEKNTWFIKSNGVQQISSRLGKINQYYRNLWFTEPDKESLKELMRKVFENKEEYLSKKKNAFVSDQFYYKNIATKVKNRIDEIEKEIT